MRFPEETRFFGHTGNVQTTRTCMLSQIEATVELLHLLYRFPLQPGGVKSVWRISRVCLCVRRRGLSPLAAARSRMGFVLHLSTNASCRASRPRSGRAGDVPGAGCTRSSSRPQPYLSQRKFVIGAPLGSLSRSARGPSYVQFALQLRSPLIDLSIETIFLLRSVIGRQSRSKASRRGSAEETFRESSVSPAAPETVVLQGSGRMSPIPTSAHKASSVTSDDRRDGIGQSKRVAAENGRQVSSSRIDCSSLWLASGGGPFG